MLARQAAAAVGVGTTCWPWGNCCYVAVQICQHNSDCGGEENTTEMWRDHFEQLYNSVDDDGFRMLFYDRLASHNACTVPFVITIHDVLECACKRKTDKAVGLGGIAMEAIVNGVLKLAVHLSILFNLFLTVQYFPSSFMQSFIIPLAKSKRGDLADVNNYRAIAISMYMSNCYVPAPNWWGH